MVDRGDKARLGGEDERDKAGRVDGAGGGDEAGLSTLASGSDEVDGWEAGWVDEPEDEGEPDAT